MKISVAQVDASLAGPENRFRWLEAKVRQAALELNIAVAYGYPERDGNTVYNAFLFIDNHGKTQEVISADIDLGLVAMARSKIPFLKDQQGVLSTVNRPQDI